MAQLSLSQSSFGNALADMLLYPDIQPGDEPSYQICKTIFSYHPLGQKIAKAPVDLAQSQEREITVPSGPEERIVRAFKEEWKKLEADRFINNVRTLSRVYGIASLAMLIDGVPNDKAVDYWKLYDQSISFNVMDPLNTAGSLVLNQNPLAMDFMKWTTISVNGQQFHRNRSCTILNEEPIYIEWTSSAFGFVGRSDYQRSLFPLKSFLQTMVTDDMISRKAGVLIAKVEQPGSVVDQLMSAIGGIKRSLLKQAQTDNVLQVGKDDAIESLNLQNIDGAGKFARDNIITNIATAVGMPAVILKNETLTEGFGEGTEDAKQVARYIDGERVKMNPLYDFFDKICMHRAWNPAFYEIIQKDFPSQYGNMDYKEAFFRWQNDFSAVWPNLLAEPDSEKIKTQDVVFKAALATVELVMALGEPESTAEAFSFLADNINANKLLFPEPLELDFDKIVDFLIDKQSKQDEMHENAMAGGEDGQTPKPGDRLMERADAARSRYDAAMARLAERGMKVVRRIPSA